jgi:DNA-binding Lrp family transcriptional regulator
VSEIPHEVPIPMSLKTENNGAPSHHRLTPDEVNVARELQGDIPLIERPFQRIAENIDLTEGEVLSIAGGLRKQNIIRKFGAIVRHQLAGYTHNVMVLWAVPPSRSAEAGEKLASFSEITHCYERTPAFAGRYNLFTMVHFRRAEEAALRDMAAAAGVLDFKVLRSIEEFKKSSMEYF